MFESVILLISILFLILGLIGSVIPIIPGPIFSYLGIILSYVFSLVDISRGEFLIISLATILVILLDYIFQYFGVKKLGGGRMSVLGLVLGTILGLLVAPLGLILGPFLGAFAGAILENKTTLITPDMSYEDIRVKVQLDGLKLLANVVKKISENKINYEGKPQIDGSYYKPMSDEEFKIVLKKIKNGKYRNE